MAFADISAFLGKGGTRAMVMKSGDHWRCVNPACQCSVLVEVSGAREGQSPRCACGGLMKKDYSPPVFRYLDFLRFPDAAPVPVPQDSRKA